jgi:aromatic ring hydroxylase
MYSEFAGRGALYERNFAGNQEQQRLDALTWATSKGDVARYKALVDDCLGDYLVFADNFSRKKNIDYRFFVGVFKFLS